MTQACDRRLLERILLRRPGANIRLVAAITFAALASWATAARAAPGATTTPEGHAGGAETGAVEPVPAPAAPTFPTFVADLDQLAFLVKGDSLLATKASDLATRRRVSAGILAGGGALGFGIGMLGMVFTTRDCLDTGLGNPPLCQNRPNFGFALVGLAVATVSALAGLAVMPSSRERAEIVDDWNQRHPDRPLTILPVVAVDPRPF